MPSREGGRLSRGLLLLLSLVTLAVLKLLFARGHHLHPPDAYYYLDIAAHLIAGDGFVTDMSMLHQGMAELPAPSTVYPLWPRALGWAGALFGLDWVARWLPNLLYFITLLLAYGLGQRLLSGSIWRWGPLHLGAGHVFAFMLGLHIPFFKMTSQPLTEGLCYALFFGLCHLALSFSKSPGLLGGLAVGAMMGLVFLTRTQLILVMMAGAPAALWMLLRAKGGDRGRAALGALGLALGLGLTLYPQVRFLQSFVDPVTLSTFLRFDQYQATELLSPIPDPLIKEGGLWGILLDRLAGFRLAFHPQGPYSYARAYHLFQYAVPLAALVLLHQAIRGPNALWGGLQGLQRAYGPFFFAFFGLFSLGGFFSIHYLHKKSFSEWHFAMRHALTAAPLFTVALLYLFSRTRWVRWVALALVLTSVGLGFYRLDMAWKQHTVDQRQWAAGYRPELTGWMQARAGGDKPLVFAMYQGQMLTYHADNTAFHWVYQGTTLEDLDTLFTQLGVQYLVISSRQRKRGAFAFVEDLAAFDARYVRVVSRKSGYDISRRR